MGGLFRAPKPVVIAPPPPSPAAPAAPAPAPAEAAAEAVTASRTEARERSRRGMAGTIATSARGVLGARADFTATRKSLLGE